ncbi:MAG: hypothetical protein A2600_13020 [Candidatus Lambdaproteobacteria bacterium RIFOXYD1_FULL_56_27]|uniref:Polysulfide reductase n=1 Tax=Candidatus Lambdaproteobacteria bacterium RIFOXYD2_FULL_56_26 TaxID=1817773 RepID=A0A1F6GL55_9PROT|nr:MAG: hypothetical protein A2557_13195 [Candidatus Lambdaproteobacteria bacterium RIFOXYD2_FULL_56_26]OGH03569.1 MAG: hypothetical protein A2426_06380 [Candidatus Lambdaproteobacteria bacterium RIFOXYC1_FULL_56_13]OGH08941.1 MAG: hypothetical protein A2600_13020 [Candidatus Lambdaproteobacteria bacterium RIFOXYD1_FULL_56_27]
MIETVTNKLNPQVLPHLQVWGWEVPVYLFCGGLAAGLLVISSGILITRNEANFSYTVRLSALLSPIVLSVGMFALFLDLAYKTHVWRFYTAFVPTSPMSWGSWLLMLFYPLAILQAVLLYEKQLESVGALKGLIGFFRPWKKLLAFVNVHIGSGIGVYTGILLATFYARPLWSNSVLGLVFLLSGMSSATALMLWMAPEEKKRFYSLVDMYLLSLEAFAITVLIIGGVTGSENSHLAMMNLITGNFAPWFWTVSLLGGILVPLSLETLETMGKVRFSPITPALVLVGGLSLRFILVFAGQANPTFF